MKILYLAPRDFPRRVANRVQTMRMAEALSRHCELILCVSKLHMKPPELWEYFGIRSPFAIEVLGDPPLRPKTPFLIPSILRSLRRHRPEIVYFREEYVGWATSFFCKNFIYEMHDYQPRLRRLYPRLVRRSLKTVVISEGLKRRAVAAGLPSEKLVVCPNAVDLDIFDIDMEKGEARRRVGLPENGRFVFYTGRFSSWKGVPTLIESAQYLTDGAQILLVGGFEGEAEAVQASIDRLGVQDRVTILGHKAHGQMPLYLKAADVLVIPTSASSENGMDHTSPLKLFEYMAARRPIVASDLPSMREIVDEGSSTLVFPDDARALADGLTRALADGPEVQQKMDNAYERGKQYSWDLRAQRILASIEVAEQEERD